MRKRLAIFILLAVLLGALAWCIWPRHEPRYQNFPASHWVDYPGYDAYFLGYFPNADSNAIPYLVKGLRRQSSPLDQVYAAFYNHTPPLLHRFLHLHAPRKFTDWMVRAGAAQVLGRIGTNSPAAIAGLIRVLRQEKNSIVKVNAIEALEKIGQGDATVEPAIIGSLNDQAPEVRDAAEDALRQMDPEAAKKVIK